jgi:hypothetical protein
MSGTCGQRSTAGRYNERGGARVKFLLTIAVLGVVAYVGYQYIPVAINAYQFKDFMQQSVNRAAAMGQSGEQLKAQLKSNFNDYGVPESATITTSRNAGRMEATVQFTRPIPLPFYIYEYNFDHTVTSTDLMGTPK